MTGHLYLYFDPAKSGTISLQYILQRIWCYGSIYGGPYQLRERNENSLANRFHPVLNDDDQGTGIEIPEEISGLVTAGKHMLISEEMLLLTQGEITWAEKAATLSNRFNDIPTTVVISPGDLVEGTPSLYHELFNWRSLRHKFSFRSFCESENARHYDSIQVREEPEQLDFLQIRYISFNAIRRGGISGTGFLGDRDILQMSGISIGHANAGEKGKDDSNQRKLGGVTLKNLGQLAPARWLIARLGFCRSSAYRCLVAWMGRVTLTPPGHREFVMPDHSANRFHAGYAGYLQALSTLERQQTLSERASDVVSRESR